MYVMAEKDRKVRSNVILRVLRRMTARRRRCLCMMLGARLG